MKWFMWALPAAALCVGCGEAGMEVGQRELEERRPERSRQAELDESRDLTGTEVRAMRPARVQTTIIGRDGRIIGSLSIEPSEQSGVIATVHVEGLEPGTHAVHFHERGRCDPPDFESAGGHFNPAGAPHGMPDADSDMNDPDHHAGDMLNQTADDLGTMDQIVINRSVNLDSGPNRLLDEDGSAFIIHAGADDYESQPAGNSGARVACAVIREVSSRGD